MVDLIDQLKQEFAVKRVYKWNGYVDDGREKEVVKIMEDAAKSSGLIPSFLGTIAIGEGLGLWIDSNYNPVPPHEVQTGKSIDGFNHLGVDHFTADFARTRKYLPKDYNEGDEFTMRQTRNEKNELVSSAVFKDLKSGIQALGATIRLRRDAFRSHGATLKYAKPGQPTVEQEAFWIYVYFQGEGRAQKYLKANGGYDYAKASPIDMREVRRLSLERVAAWKFIQSKKIFSA